MDIKTIKDFEYFRMNFLIWDTRRIYGFYQPIFASGNPELNVGQLLRHKMESGRNAIFYLSELEYRQDPKDQYFGTVLDVGYEDDLISEMETLVVIVGDNNKIIMIDSETKEQFRYPECLSDGSWEKYMEGKY